MWRLIALVLLVANTAWLAWAQDLLRPWGLGPAPQIEPQRLGQQINPQALRVVQGDEARRLAEPPPPAPTECWTTAPLPEAVAAQLRQVLTPWPAGSWTLEPAVEPGRWIIYMGKYPNAEALERKKSELRRRGVTFEPITQGALSPGLSLGDFTTQAAANDQLVALTARGVRSARVLQEVPEQRGPVLRLAAVDETLRARLSELRGPLAGRPLQACR